MLSIAAMFWDRWLVAGFYYPATSLGDLVNDRPIARFWNRFPMLNLRSLALLFKGFSGRKKALLGKKPPIKIKHQRNKIAAAHFGFFHQPHGGVIQILIDGNAAGKP